ncbi:hypothetical protein NT6N_21020 [Oceaniferula spumae]|uniref:Transcriptional regulator LacI/GalR-like sensor domain-containing protein n=1 Tax=Oceaniferula spumae TaxID=2979115 RepID=A0AAT9FM71_9BACT
MRGGKVNKRSVAEMAADVMQADIVRGEWVAELPSYRILAERYGVGRHAMLQALRILEQRGYVTEGKRGEARQVRLGGGVGKLKRSKTLLAIGRKAFPMDPSEVMFWNEMRHVWRLEAGDVSEVQLDMSRGGNVAERLRSLIKKFSADAVLVQLPSDRWARALVDSGLPVYARGGSLQNVMGKVAGASYFHDSVVMILRELRSRGHVRVLMALDSASERVLEAYRENYRKVFGKLMAEDVLASYVTNVREDVPEVWSAHWRKHLAGLNPTAVLCQSVQQYLSLYGFCYASGIRIPRDLSAVCIGDVEMTKWLSPKPVWMKYPYEKELEGFKQWMHKGLPVFSTMALEWMEGGTVRDVSGA